VNIRIQDGTIGSLLINDTGIRMHGVRAGSLTIRTVERRYTRPTLLARLTRPFRDFAAWWSDMQPNDRLGHGLAFGLIGCTVLLAVLTPFELQNRAREVAALNAAAVQSTVNTR